MLWHAVVLGESNDQVTQRMGTNANAIGVLSFRAREGLRQAYLTEHLRDANDPEC